MKSGFMKRSILVFISLFFLQANCGCVWAAGNKDMNDAGSLSGIYFVSTSGDDLNPGTIEKPWKTIQKAADTLQPGETVYIRGGVYPERVILHGSGTPEKYITISSYQGEEVVIDGRSIDWGYDWDCLFRTNGQSYIRVDGLKVINARYAGIGDCQLPENAGNHIIVQNCSTDNTQASGIMFYNGSDVAIYNNVIRNPNTSGNQEAISLDNIDGFDIRNNQVFTRKEGIDAKNGCRNGRIVDNVVYEVVKADGSAGIGIYIDAFAGYEYNIEVTGNKIYDCNEGIAVATESGGMLENINIHDNTVSNCTWGLTVAGWGTEGKSHAMKDIFF